MKHLKLFEEFESPLIKAVQDLRAGSKEVIKAAEYWKEKSKKPTSHIDFQEPGIVPGQYVEETPEDLNLERMEKRIITNAIIKNYKKGYEEIAKMLGMDTRSLFRKMDQYDLKDLKRQLRIRKGVAWDHPYNELVPRP